MVATESPKADGSASSWRDRFTFLHTWPEWYPAPQRMPHKRPFWISMTIVALLVLTFAAYFIAYLTGQHNAYLTNAEDLGIMDQAIWSAAHGQPFRQTVCNIIGDTNCVSLEGVTRYAIHFEPILVLFALLYLVVPSPHTLLVVQTLIVALGAFPAFWLARLRLRNDIAAIGFALLYLLYPALQSAATYDFHAVTLTASFLMFVFYFMYTRRTGWMFVFALLAMACKEEVPGIVALTGLWMLVFQKRWRSGLGLMVLASVWVGSALFVMRLASPTGAPLLAERFSETKDAMGPKEILLNPVEGFKRYVLEPAHLMYLRMLFTPAGYLMLLAPWVLVIALPALALNMLSSNAQMYSGMFQYNAEIVPVLIFASIEAVVLILAVLRFSVTRLTVRDARGGVQTVQTERVGWMSSRWRVLEALVLSCLLALMLFSTVRADAVRGDMPFSQGFSWPMATPHTRIAPELLAKIPADASVSAQSRLVPHLSQREKIYLFPYGGEHADYVLLDVSSDMYPFYGTLQYVRQVKKVLMSGQYGVVAAQDGYILLKRGLQAPKIAPFSPVKDSKAQDKSRLLPELPNDFCSYVETVPNQVKRSLDVTFSLGGEEQLHLVDYAVGAPSTVNIGSGYVSVDTYWRVDKPVTQPVSFVLFMRDQQGQERMLDFDFPALFWCQTPAWKPGTIVRISSKVMSTRAHGFSVGANDFALALVPFQQPYNRLMEPGARIPLTTQGSATDVQILPTKALRLKSLTLTR